MKHLKFSYLVAMLLFAFTFVSCDKDNDDLFLGDKITYQLEERNNSGISGTIIFEELESGSIQAIIDLKGTQNGTSLPAHVHANSSLVGGEVIIPLDDVDGATGSSVTIFSSTLSGQKVDIDLIKNMDAYVNVHESASNLQTIVAQVDIGNNELTGEQKEYSLNEKDVEGISGKIIFMERKNGFAVAKIEMTNYSEDVNHPAHIHYNTAAAGGAIAIALNSVNKSSGISMTDIRQLGNGESITYQELLAFDGYVNVHLSESQLSTIIAQADIGRNELTGEKVDYELKAGVIGNVSGLIRFEERKDGSILTTVIAAGLSSNITYSAQINENSFEEGGGKLITLNNIEGDEGISQTSMKNYDNGAAINYKQLLLLDGHFTLTALQGGVQLIVASANIGVNSSN